MNKRAFSLLALILLVSGAISIALLTRGQSWLDDFAEYIMQAQSILNHSMGDFILQNAFTVSHSSYPPGPVAYPWGFPLLLAPVYAVFGLNTLALKLINTLSYTLFLVLFFALARTRLQEAESLLLTAILAFNPALLVAHDQIISDIPFLLFSTLGIFLIDRFARQKLSAWTGIAIGSAIFAAAFIRANGILLLVPLGLVQLRQLRQDRQGGLARLPFDALPYLAFGVLFLLQAWIFPNGQESYLSHFSMFTPQGLWDNFVFYLWLPASTFNGLPGGVVIYPLLLVFLCVSLRRLTWREVPIHAYSLATLGLFIIWPERQGLRFIYPVLPFLFIYAGVGTNLAAAWLKETWQRPARTILRYAWLLLALVSLGIAVGQAGTNLADNRTITGPFDPVSAEMFKFLREKTPANSVVIFYRPRAMHLMSARSSFVTDTCANLSQANYLALSKKVELNGLIPLQELTRCDTAPLLKNVFENRRFIVYKIGQ